MAIIWIRNMKRESLKDDKKDITYNGNMVYKITVNTAIC